jgi:hypothetical protein
MGEDLLTSALSQAERSDAPVRAAALMRIARVQTVLAPAEARRTFERGLQEMRLLPPSQPDFLLQEQARILAAAVDPDLLSSIPPTERARHHFEPERLAQTMLEHGHVEQAYAFVLGHSDDSTFPFGMAPMLMQRVDEESRKLALLRRALKAWRAAPTAHSQFLWVFQTQWKTLPPHEALEVVREIVRYTLEQPEFDGHGTYDAEGAVQIHSGRENNLFQILHVLRRLDPDLAAQLMAGHSQLAAAAIRFPYGMESVQEEGEARRRAAGGAASGGGFIMSGSRRDFAYMESLMQAKRGGEFAAPIEHALERYREDAAPDDPNLAPREFWPSTSAFRSILYAAGVRLGVGAAALLDRIPDADVRLFAQIELAAALAALPEVRGSQSEYHPQRNRRGRMRSAAVHERETEVSGASHDDMDEPHIRCPQCKWRPRTESRWRCKCGHIWNTFDTGGICPGCLHEWKATQCLECGVMSPHSDWYTHR